MKYHEPNNIKQHNQNQMQLFPSNVRSFIDEDHLCFVVNDEVYAPNLSSLYTKVLSNVNHPYHPAMMLTILFVDGAHSPNNSSKIVSGTNRIQYGE